MIGAFVFLLGLCVGSFLNAFVYRLAKEESAFKGRSYCPKCKHQLSSLDLVPVLSFLFLLGKCRYCKKPISLQYPIVEFSTGVLFTALFLLLSPQNMLEYISFAFSLFIASGLIAIFAYDLKHFLIPDVVLFPIMGAAGFLLVQKSIEQGTIDPLRLGLFSALGAAGFFLALFLVSKGAWMGFGDVKFAFFMGLFLSWPSILPALFVAFFLGAVIGIALILLKKKQWKSQVPFGPFLIFGTFSAIFFGKQLVDYYSGLLVVY
ncbi:MAG: prepilin peptidase [Candidatus Wildermuthbacteria bacterium]|nr:prepilin peptidase [Candidatus Wildermuthbacteria bacterium]